MERYGIWAVRPSTQERHAADATARACSLHERSRGKRNLLGSALSSCLLFTVKALALVRASIIACSSCTGVHSVQKNGSCTAFTA